jgi:twitching motility protein PilT
VVAQLDRFFQVLVERGAQELRLRSGEAPVFIFGGEPKPASSARPTGQQLLALLGEVVGPDQLAELRESGELACAIQSDGLPPLWAEMRINDGTVVATFRAAPAGGTKPAPEPPPAEQSAPAAAPDSSTTGAFALVNEPEPPAPPADDEPDPIHVTTSRPILPADDDDPADGPAPPTQRAPEEAPQPVPVSGDDGPAIDQLFRMMVESGSSDLHLSSGEKPILRLDGSLERIDSWPEIDPERMEELLAPIMPSANREEFAETSDTDFAYEITGLARFRCNVFADRKGPGAVFRVIPAKILTAEQLNLSPQILDLCRLSKGLVLVTGPTGSGKSTTLTAMIDYINRTRADHVITIEDPIEFVHDNKKCLINQREVGIHTQGFKKALRAALREDPDIVLVGEMRDLETIAIAIETAETGHLVFGTLHTTTAVSTVDRIIDQFPTGQQAQVRTMLSESLRGVIAQTLCKKIGGGRIAALEVLIGTPSVANLIREGKTFQIPSIMQTGKKFGMIGLNEALTALVKQDLVTPEKAYFKAVDKNGLLNMLRQINKEPKFEPAPA